jgi:hypothetical protein
MRGPEWPTHRLAATEVRDWISRVAPGHPNVTGPVRILQAKDWGVTAVFATDSLAFPERLVVFKACCVSIFRDAPRIAEILDRSCPGHVPRVLAWRQDHAQTWTLFQPFSGPTAKSVGTPQALIDLARTMAYIQVTVSERRSELESLTHLRVREIPTLLESVLAYVREKHERYWVGQEGPRAELMPDLPRVLERARAFHSLVERWAEELAADGWPDSLDHPDLHADNAVIQPDGRLLIFDWEEAIVTLPFLSLGELLANASTYSNTTVASVRRAYLEALPWGSFVQRARALDLALLLLPIKKAHEYRQLDRAIGREAGNRHLALILTDVVHRWEAVASST